MTYLGWWRTHLLSVSYKFEVCAIFFLKKEKYYGKPRYKCLIFMKTEVK